MDGSKVRPDSDMNAHEVDNKGPEDLGYSTVHNEGNLGIFLLMITYQ
jgi:hypothetical protein